MSLSRRELLLRAGLASAVGAGGVWGIGRLLERGSVPEDMAPLMPAGDDEPGWSDLVELVDGRGRGAYPVHAILLNTGRVLMIGGAAADFFEFSFDPGQARARTTVRRLDLPFESRMDYLECAGHAYLADGRLLVAGGSRSDGEAEEGLRYAMLFEPADFSWARVDEEMAGGGRWYPAVTRLSDSRLLVTSGFFDFGEDLNRSIEVFDPAAAGTGVSPWTELISDAENRAEIEPTGEDYTQVFVLPRPIELEGRQRQVAMFGRAGVVHFLNYTDSFEDPNERLVTTAGSARPAPLGTRDRAAGASGVFLGDGRIMIVGGGKDRALLQRADIYDPVDDSWTGIDTGIGRLYPTAVLLPDGTVLITGGEIEDDVLGDPRCPQLIDPSTRRVETLPAWPEAEARGYHNVALLLGDGRVLVGGGAGNEKSTPNNERTDLRFFSPPYLSEAPNRPRIVAAPAELRLGGTYAIAYTNGPIHRVVLMALGAMTHCFDQNQRLVTLFDGESGAEGKLTVDAPADAASAPPGDYLVFVLARTGGSIGPLIPSVARVVRVMAA